MMIAILLAAATPAAATPPVPSAEADALGAELSRLGFIGTIGPKLAEQETAKLVAAHPELSDAEKAELRATAQTALNENLQMIYTSVGHSYAQLMSVEDLRAVVAFERTPAATHYRAAMPVAMMQSMEKMRGLDFSARAIAAFCAKTGKLCPPKQP